MRPKMSKELFSTHDDTYNLSPLRYPWAYNMYKTARKNFWNPEEVNMTQDIASFRSMSVTQQEMFLDVFATLTTSDLVIQENIALRLYELLDIPELRLWLGHQIADESLHSHTYQHIIENLSLGDDTIYQRYKRKPYIGQKFGLGAKVAERLNGKDHVDYMKRLISAIAFYYLGWEGIWFYHGFTPIFALGRLGLMPATISQLLYIARDEVTHVAFGVALLRTLKDEGYMMPEVIEEIHYLLVRLYDVEEKYILGAMPEPIIGYSVEDHLAHTRYMIDKRLWQCGLPQVYGMDLNNPPISWLGEMIEHKKERNFFETKVTEYQVGGIDFGESTPTKLDADNLWAVDFS